MTETETRRYRIKGILGKGGFGQVYHAVMEGVGGFEKEVAIKLLRDEDVPENTLKRFRDEARILGLVRDRAVVTVDPPTRLGGRWALVMEFVDGASLHRLLKSGPMPTAAAAAVVAEVARALERVYVQPGPSGAPLRLLHRDIKPGNIQLTPDGQVKLLDFGIAKAEFETREATTNAYIGGTRGFIAPERMEGIDSPAGDIFSLGVTAHWMVLGERPTRRQMMGLEAVDDARLDAGGRRLVRLATRMRSVDAQERPTAGEVQEICQRILDQSQGTTLQCWAAAQVPRCTVRGVEDAMVGSVLSETLEALPDSRSFPPSEPPRPKRRWSMATAAGAALMLGVAVAIVAVTGLAVALWQPPEAPAARGAAQVVHPARVTTPRPPAVAPLRSVPTKRDTPRPTTPPQVRPPAPPAPVEPKAPAPAPKPARTRTITISSVPLGAQLFVDGKPVGRTPVMGFRLPEGKHTLRLSSAIEESSIEVRVGANQPSRYVWKGGERWERHH